MDAPVEEKDEGIPVIAMNFAIARPIESASASPAAVKERARSVVKEKYPNYKIIVLNDDHNTFQHVVATLTTYIPGMDSDTAWDLAHEIHNQGQAVVWTGPLEQAELYHAQLIRAGLTMAPLEKA